MMNDEVENGRIIGIGDFLLVLILKDTWPSRRLFFVFGRRLRWHRRPGFFFSLLMLRLDDC